MIADRIELSSRVADALSDLGLGEINRCETPDRMAWIVLVLRRLDDTPERFPHGKWATIQSIESQLEQCADFTASGIK